MKKKKLLHKLIEGYIEYTLGFCYCHGYNFVLSLKYLTSAKLILLECLKDSIISNHRHQSDKRDEALVNL